jgi:hypothetical protein
VGLRGFEVFEGLEPIPELGEEPADVSMVVFDQFGDVGHLSLPRSGGACGPYPSAARPNARRLRSRTPARAASAHLAAACPWCASGLALGACRFTASPQSQAGNEQCGAERQGAEIPRQLVRDVVSYVVDRQNVMIDDAFDEVERPQPARRSPMCDRHGGASSPRDVVVVTDAFIPRHRRDMPSSRRAGYTGRSRRTRRVVR